MLLVAGTFVLASVSTLPALAQDEPTMVDARLEGYGTDRNNSSIALPESGTALIFILFIFLGLLCCGVMFKDAKRSHLD